MTTMESSLAEHIRLFGTLTTLLPMVQCAAEIIAYSISNGGKVMFAGNGGSAADAQHLAAELIGKLKDDRIPLPGLALTTDSSALTCIGNDYGFPMIFARQVLGLGRAGDVLVILSTSGNSENIRLALECANSHGIHTIGFLGKDGGDCLSLCDYPILVQCNNTARIQEAHGFLGHELCGAVEGLVLR
jgi:D-sedoheptulose 7-phosphate isomerase